MITSIYSEIWKLSSNPNMLGAYAKLQSLTQQLINIYDEEGRLDENPFTSTAKRKLSVPFVQIESLLENSTCLVTGGLGCVGSCLVNKLLRFGVKKIIIIDKANRTQVQETEDNIIFIQADICNLNSLVTVFETFNPDYVFHTAAQRDPGYAEKHVLESINSNVLGTLNVVKACEMSSSVQQCIFSSTGKASRYYTEDIYAATKKVCEYILATYARQSTIKYSIVRFTHILENSLMHSELQNIKNIDYLPIHSPGKYVTAQNVSEAADLLLNALLHSQIGQCHFLLVKNLEWPVESLEVALYYIKRTGSSIPVIFNGNPPGYSEKFFRGQVDWSNVQELNLLINVYECKNKELNAEGDIIISRIVPTSKCILHNVLYRLQNAASEKCAKECLLSGLREIVEASLLNVDKNDTLNILQWGLQPEHLIAEGTTVDDYNPVVSILMNSLYNSAYGMQAASLIRPQVVANYK